MGKIGATSNDVDIEVIPVDIHRRRPSNLHQISLDPSMKMMQRIPYMSDPTIVPRVQKYLEANVHKHYIDINSMADDLQRTYREYSKRKRSAFRSAVKKAYAIVMKTYSLPLQHQSSSEEDVSDESGEDRIDYGDARLQGIMFNQLAKPPQQPGELIDISSDDGEESLPNIPSMKSTNGPPPQRHQKHPLMPLPPHISINPVVVGKGENSNNKNLQSERGKKRKLEHEIQNNYTTAAPKKKKSLAAKTSVVTFDDVAGIPNILMEISRMMMHIKNPDLWRQHGRDPPTGFLLHGPPGCGKSLIVKAIAGEYGIPLWKVSAPELVGGISGESEERVRDLFKSAVVSAPCIIFIDEIDSIAQKRQFASKDMEKRIVTQLLTCMDDLSATEEGQQVIVIGATNRRDSIDPALRRSGRFNKEISVGIPDTASRLDILKLLSSTCKLDDDVNLELIAKNIPGYVGADIAELIREAIVSCAARLFDELKEIKKLEQAIILRNKMEKTKTPLEKAHDEVAIDADKSDPEIIVDGDSKDKIELKPDSEEQSNTNDSAVVVIDDDVKQANEKLNPEPSVSTAETNEVSVEDKLEEILPSKDPLDEIRSFNSIKLTKDQISNMLLTMEDFQEAMKRVQPSAKREGFATVPDVTWEDIGSLETIREELQMDILTPVRYPKQSKALGLGSAGIFLCGPPGCGKTLLAKAIANEAGINFISVNGPELFNMYVGESERAVRMCFERARNSAPCVIFFDEIDALCQKRSDSAESSSSSRVVNQLLTEMDGIQKRNNVFLLAASNRPDVVDPAILRPGRLDKIIYVGMPTPTDRVEILKAITKNGQKPLLAPDVDLEIIGKSDECQGYTGADLANLVKEAAREAFRDLMKGGDLDKACVVMNEHFTRAVAKVKPSVSEKDQKIYEKLNKLYAVKKDEIVEEMEYS